MTDHTGKILGNWRLESLLGAGCFGAVYRAVNPVIGQEAAVKVLHKERATQDIRRRFFAEARAASMARLNEDDPRPHPGVVQIFDGDDGSRSGDGTCYIVMERLWGVTLHERLVRSGPLTPLAAAQLGQILADTLLAVHRRGVVHRDLKPENIFLQAGDPQRPKILDFGIAKLRAGQLGTVAGTVPGTVMGTPHYMSPEQGQGHDDIDERSDVYSLGVILFRCVSGEVPFDGPNYQRVLFQHLYAEVPPLPPGTPEPLVRLIRAMLEKDRAWRPGTLEARDHLRQIIAVEAERPPPAGPGSPTMDSMGPFTLGATGGGMRRRRARAGLALLGAAVSAVLLLARWPGPDPAPTLVPARPAPAQERREAKIPIGYLRLGRVALQPRQVTIGEFHHFVDAERVARKGKWPWAYSSPLPGDLVMNHVSPELAQRYCRWAVAGRLPVKAELRALPAPAPAFPDLAMDQEPRGLHGFRCAVDLAPARQP